MTRTSWNPGRARRGGRRTFAAAALLAVLAGCGDV